MMVMQFTADMSCVQFFAMLTVLMFGHVLGSL